MFTTTVLFVLEALLIPQGRVTKSHQNAVSKMRAETGVCGVKAV